MPEVFNHKQEPSKPVGLLSSFCPNPHGVAFSSQEKDERILLYLRKHFVTNLPWTTLVLTLLTLPLVLFFLNIILVDIFTFLSFQDYVFLISLYYLVVLIYAFVEFITWFYNISLVTTKRIVDIDFSNLVYHNVAATKLELVEDVDYSQTGFIRSLFNYGDVFVQTAGGKVNFDFLAVPRPTRVEKIIIYLIGNKGGKHGH